MAEIKINKKTKELKQRNAKITKEYQKLANKGIRPGLIQDKLAKLHGLQCPKSIERIVKGRKNKKK